MRQWKENLGFLKDRVLTFQSEMSESMKPALENVGRISEQSTKGTFFRTVTISLFYVINLLAVNLSEKLRGGLC